MSPADLSTDACADSFTVWDWLGTAWTGLTVLALLAFPGTAGTFRAMYADLGDVALPPLTMFVTQQWVPPVLATGPLALLANGMRAKLGLRRRRLSVVAAFVLSSTLFAVCLWGVYLPIFEVAGAIK